LRKDIRFTSKKSKEALEIEDQIKLIEQRLADPSDLSTVNLFPDDNGEVDIYTMLSSSAPSQPFAVLYSTNRLLSRIGPRLPPVSDVYLSSAFGNALTQSEVSFYDFANWFRAVLEGAIQMPSLSGNLLHIIELTLMRLLPGMSGLQLHTEGQPQFSLNKGDKRLYLWQLSDGEQGLLALVLDLLRRLAIANPFTENPVENGFAIVLVDEIELHLHPKWQRDVIKRLPVIFKNCQFIFTTHSPQVIGEVEARCVRLLSRRDEKIVVETPAMSLGTDSNWILNVLMEADEMNEEIEQALNEISSLISARKLESANEMLQQLRARIGNTKAIQQRASTIERIERLGR
jgi:hypothetical protein